MSCFLLCKEKKKERKTTQARYRHTTLHSVTTTQNTGNTANTHKTLLKETKATTHPLFSQSPHSTTRHCTACRPDSPGITALLYNGSFSATHPQDESDILDKSLKSLPTQEHADLPDIPTSPHPALPPLYLNTQGIEKLLSEPDTDKVTGPDNNRAEY